MKDVKYAVAAVFNGIEQLWPAGLYSTPEDAEKAFRYTFGNNEACEFIRAVEVVLE